MQPTDLRDFDAVEAGAIGLIDKLELPSVRDGS